MLKKILINALIPLGLAVAFYFFFMTTKHDATLSTIMPFGNDPYDAIGSFGVETALFLGILSCIRTLRLYGGKEKPVVEQNIFLARAQMGIVLAVLLTLVGDVVAMLRHLSQWTGQAATNELLLLMVGMLLFALLVGILVAFSTRTIRSPRTLYVWRKGSIVFVTMVIILAFYPENLIKSTIGELFTVIAGALLLFVPLWALGDVLIPFALEKQEQRNMSARHTYQWIIVLLLAIGIGLYVVLGEITDGGQGIQVFQLFQHLYIVFIYVGLELSAVIIGYSLLRKQLGLFRRR